MIKSENGKVMIEGHLIDVLADLQTLLYGIVHDNDIPIDKNMLVLMASNANQGGVNLPQVEKKGGKGLR